MEESSKTRQTLELDFIFRALNQHGADGVQVVIVTASQRARAGLCHLGDVKPEEHFQINRCVLAVDSMTGARARESPAFANNRWRTS